MAEITSDCPHCGSQNMTFSVFGTYTPDRLNLGGNLAVAMAAGACRRCNLPVVAELRSNQHTNPSGIQSEILTLMQRNQTLNGHALLLTRQWPLPPASDIPEELPENVAKAYRQAEDNFHREGNEDASAMMFRKALELGLKTAYPTMTGSLANRIRKLTAESHLPSSLADWLDQVRLVGNEGAHDIDGVDRQSLEAARSFVDMALRYIFTLPAQVAHRRGLPTEVA